MIPVWAHCARNWVCYMERNLHAGAIKGTGTGPKPPLIGRSWTHGRPGGCGLSRHGETRLLTSSSIVVWHGPRKLGPDPSTTFYSSLFQHLSLVVALLGQRSHGSSLPSSKRPPQTTRGGRQRQRTGRRQEAGAASALSDAEDGYVRLPMLVNHFLSLIFFSFRFSSIPRLFLSIFPPIATSSPLLLLVLHSSFSEPFHPFDLPNHPDLKGIDLLICRFIKQDLSMNGPLGGFPWVPRSVFMVRVYLTLLGLTVLFKLFLMCLLLWKAESTVQAVKPTAGPIFLVLFMSALYSTLFSFF